MDTFVRYYLILSLLKPYPRRVTCTDIRSALGNQGVDPRVLRTIQRDLEKLSAHFPIDGDQRKPRGWCWANDASVLLPGMDLHTALTFRLMNQFMQPLIPTACLAAATRQAGATAFQQGSGDKRHGARHRPTALVAAGIRRSGGGVEAQGPARRHGSCRQRYGREVLLPCRDSIPPASPITTPFVAFFCYH